MQEALKMTDNQDLDWPLLDRDFKSGVIYHDKLISDALFGQPIKTEHSYSLNSDGDSIPDSPRSHHNKIDGNCDIRKFIYVFFSFILSFLTLFYSEYIYFANVVR